MSVWRWADWIDDVPAESRLSLGEGHTPLVRSHRIGPSAGIKNLFFKLESSNPSGSYKDRFAAVAISLLVARGKRRCVATSSGNTGSALAAYCHQAAAGIPCEIGASSMRAGQAKLQQMMAYGAGAVSHPAASASTRHFPSVSVLPRCAPLGPDAGQRTFD